MNKSKLKSVAALSALGVVYGDIGTSPLYALKESFHHTHHLSVTPVNIYGILSLIFWSLILIISIKYLVFIVKADNKGEGGVLALTALITNYKNKSPKTIKLITLFGIFGTALLYGDGMITPAISVLSAVEGLEYIAPQLRSYVLPITITILVLLFSIQKHGTEVMGKIFGPLTLLWFIVLGMLGISQIINQPQVLQAVNPYYAFIMFKTNGWQSFSVLGSVFLVVTGGEALYSDLGHFGVGPIRLAWFTVVLPALVLNYFGQGAMLVDKPLNIESPFFLMAPQWALIPLVILATFSTVVASQALITGVFSLTMQAVQLQYVPRLKISHTSSKERGQVYVAAMNLILMIACILLVLTFKTSSNLAAAYGIAVTTTMVITTFLFYFYARYAWNWSVKFALPLCLFLLLIEGSFWSANLLKVFDGGWFPILIGLMIFTIMTTWNKGRELIANRMKQKVKPLSEFLAMVQKENPFRSKGFAVYMSGSTDHIPVTLAQSYHHFNALHEHLIFLTIKTSDFAHIPSGNRIKFQNIGPHIYRMIIEYGFMDLPNLHEELKDSILLDKGIVFDPNKATFFLGREHILSTPNKGMAIWREQLFAMMTRNSQSANSYFKLPRDRVIEIGSVIEI